MKKRIVGLLAGIALVGGVGSANALPLNNGDFDAVDSGYIGTRWGTPLDDVGTGGSFSNWDVYDSLPGGWFKKTGTAGIEIQTSGTLPGVSAHSGKNYVELDSNWPLDGTPGTNSSMYQSVFLNAGSYELSFWYLPRTADGDDNGIFAYINSPGYVDIGSISLANPPATAWQNVSWTFSIAAAGSYDLYFAADGKDNKLGGFIDSVALNPVPEPATMLLFGAGLAGLAGSRLRRKK